MSDAEASKLRTMRRREENPVRHQATCPCCGKKMTSIYRRDDEWKCKKCWDKIDAKEMTVV
jgi:tRNA(Ile2) C34 agmatinyltransferase TiaS